MKFRIRHADQVVGAFIAVAILALAAALVLTGVNKRWFAKNYHFRSEFETASSLSPGMAINFKGFVIGKISKVSLNDRDTVDVDFYVYDTYYPKVREFSLLELSVSPIGLGSQLLFHEGRGKALLPEGSFVNRADTDAGKAIADAGLVDMPKKDDTITRILADIGPIMDNANKVLANFNKALTEINADLHGDGTGPLGRTLNGASGSMASVKAVMDDIHGELPGIMASLSTVVGNAQKITDDLKGTSSALKDPTGLLPRLMGPKGSIQTLLADDNALYDRIQSMLGKVDEALSSVSSMTGRLDSAMPSISLMLEDTKVTLKKAQDVLDALKNNPLLSGGVPQAKEQENLIRSSRGEEF